MFSYFVVLDSCFWTCFCRTNCKTALVGLFRIQNLSAWVGKANLSAAFSSLLAAYPFFPVNRDTFYVSFHHYLLLREPGIDRSKEKVEIESGLVYHLSSFRDVCRHRGLIGWEGVGAKDGGGQYRRRGGWRRRWSVASQNHLGKGDWLRKAHK